MPSFGRKLRAKRAREASVREQEQLLDTLLEEGEPLPESELRIYREVDPSSVAPNPVAYPFQFGGDPFPYYRFSPYYFGGNAQQGRQPNNVETGQPSQKSIAKQNQSSKKLLAKKGAPDGRPAEGYYPPSGYGYQPYHTQNTYPGYYPYPTPYGYPPAQSSPYPAQQGHYPGQPSPYPGQPSTYPGQASPYLGQPNPYPQYAPRYPPAPEPSETDNESGTLKSGMMSIEGRRPLFLVALFVVSIAVLLVSFPLTLLSAGYIGPLGLMFATGPFATVFAFWAIYLTPCECYPNVEWATSRIRVFATAAAVFDAVGTIGVPISMYGAQCPDDDDTMLGCEDELPAAKGISMAVAVVLGTHCFLCLLVRSNARKLAESKFGDERTEGITLTPTPFDRT